MTSAHREPDGLSHRELLSRGAESLGVAVSAQAADKIVNYLSLLIKWNARINLTGTRDTQTIVERHILDCLAITPHLPARPAHIADVGSGAGLPGAILAAYRDDWTVTALEPIRKKHAFLAAVRRELGMQNLRPVAERLDAHCAHSGDQYDVAVSRATFALTDWLEIALKLVKPGGLVLGMEARATESLPPGAQRVPYSLPGDASRTRAIILLQAPDVSRGTST